MATLRVDHAAPTALPAETSSAVDEPSCVLLEHIGLIGYRVEVAADHVEAVNDAILTFQ